MSRVPDTSLGRMYAQHIELLRSKDIDRLLSMQYAPDALLVSSAAKEPRYYRGHAEIRLHVAAVLDVDGLESEVVFWAETDEPRTLMVTEKVSFVVGGRRERVRFADTWVLRDGLIAIHFAGMVQYADGSLA